METKADKAALAKVEILIQEAIEEAVKIQPSYVIYDLAMNSKLRKIKKLISKHNLDSQLFNEAIEKIYDSVMKHKNYDFAISSAKKYGL